MKIPSVHECRGYMAQQVPGFEDVISEAFDSEHFETIVEIGTGRGGFIAFMRTLYPLAEIHSWDIVQHLSAEQSKALDLNFHCCDALKSPSIQMLIDGEERTLVICDGGNKIEEFRKFARYLKPGDMIMCHDYCQSHAEFEATMRGRVWNWLEITDADIAEAIEENGLVAVHTELRDIAWGCWIKS